MLFIDSTHVSKPGSDVNYLFERILPRLAVGVYVHLHDVFYPFEYPPAWILRGRVWQEAYMLRAFLQYNDSWQIELFNTFLEARREDWFKAELPVCLLDHGGSIWIRRVA